MVLRKTATQIALMRRAGSVVAEMHEVCTRAAVPGATTADLDAAAREVLERRNARSNFLGYHGFPAVACVSPNEVIVHGIPGARVLEEGDIVSIDCGAIIEGWHADAAITVPVGEVDAESQRLMDVTRAALDVGHLRHRRGEPAGRHRRRGRAAGHRGPVRGGPRVRRARHRDGHARGARGAELRAGGPGDEAAGRDRARHRAHGHRRPGHRPARSTTAGRSSPPTAPAPPTSSTPSPSPTTARRS